MNLSVPFTLPSASEWHRSENCAVNLREHRAGAIVSLVPAGSPAVRLASAGAMTCELPSGSLLSVGADRVSVSIDGKAAGTLAAPFSTLLPDGPDVMLFTSGGVEWLSSGSLQGPMPAVNASFAVTERFTASVSVAPPALKGSYSRPSGPLLAADCERVASAYGDALSALERRALESGAGVQPRWVAWRLKDSAGRVLAVSSPVWVGADSGFQALGPLQFQASHDGSHFALTSSATLSAAAYGLRLSVDAPSLSDFWRRRIAAIEVIASAPADFFGGGVTGSFARVSSAASVLTVSPSGTDSTSLLRLKAAMLERFAATASVVAVADFPPSGGSVDVAFSSTAPLAADVSAEPLPPVSTAYAGGTVVAYSPADASGELILADSGSPLVARCRARVSSGRILRICTPAGGSGGWNYGRHHLLVFASDGVYSVSADRQLRTLGASQLLSGSVGRQDAVAPAPECVYAVVGGSVVAIRGSRIETIEVPCRPAALMWCQPMAELWVLGEDGSIFAMTRSGCCSQRTDVGVVRFFGRGLAVDTAGAVRDLAAEEAVPVEVRWRRRSAGPVASGMIRWDIAARGCEGLELLLEGDSGAASECMLRLEVSGAMGAPVSAAVVARPRPYFTVGVEGTLVPPARLAGVTVRDSAGCKSRR